MPARALSSIGRADRAHGRAVRGKGAPQRRGRRFPGAGGRAPFGIGKRAKGDTMHQLAATMRAWRESGRRFAVAVAVRTWGSSPQEAGACMIVDEDGRMAGSVSGGCIEGAVAQAAMECLEQDAPRLLEFHATDDQAWEVGIPCGGEVSVFVSPFDDEVHAAMLGLMERDAPFVHVACIDEKSPLFGAQACVEQGEGEGAGAGVGARAGAEADARAGAGVRVGSWMDDTLLAEALDAFRVHRERRFKREGALHDSAVLSVMGSEVFVHRVECRPTLVCVGAVHIAEALVEMGRMLRFRTVVIDPRAAFLAGGRFAQADQVLQAWPQDAFGQIDAPGRLAVCVLTHDEKIDVPALEQALGTNAFYIGCLGSPETLLDRRAALEKRGFCEADFRRIHGPIGLYIGGGRRPEAIALSAMAQIVAAMTGRIAFGEDMPGHTLDHFTPEQVARIDAARAVPKGGRHA